MLHRRAIGDLMKKLGAFRRLSLIVCCGVAALAMSASALAQHAGEHMGGPAGHGGYGGGYHGGYGGRGGYGGHGGYGWDGYSWRGGYGYYGGPWGWGALGVGLYVATLPLYYSTIWWGGVPYYYADSTYYRWNGAVARYETVAAPALQNQGAAPDQGISDLMVYPKNGQSQQQQATDKFECHRWAVGQTGFDPSQVTSAPPPGKRSEYFRAQTACLEGRGYTVK